MPGLTPYGQMSNLPGLVALSPTEQAAEDAYETSPQTRTELEQAIAQARTPQARAALTGLYAQDFGGGSPGTGLPAPQGSPAAAQPQPQPAPTAPPGPADRATPQPTVIRTMDDLRSWYGDAGKGLSDTDMMQGLARVTGTPASHIADQFGYDPGSGSITGERATSALAGYAGALQELGGAISRKVGATGLASTFDRWRNANEFQDQVASERAAALGGVNQWKNVHNLSDFGSYLGGGAIAAGPILGEIAATSLAGSALAGPVGAGVGLVEGGMDAVRALRAASTAGDLLATARLANIVKNGSLVGSALGDAPLAVGNLLQTQRQQSGTEDLGAAALGALPYVALDVGLGSGRLLAGRTLPTSGLAALDDLTGVRGAFARTGATGLRLGAEQAIDSLGREAITQVAGRMAVDPNETFYNDASADRFKEAAVGGATLGSALGMGLGGWRRGPPAELSGEGTDLLDRGQSAGQMPGALERGRTGEPAADQAPPQTAPASDVAEALQRTAPEGLVLPGEAAPGAPTGAGVDPAQGQLPPAPTMAPGSADTTLAQPPVASSAPPVAVPTVDPSVEAARQQQAAIEESAARAAARQKLAEDTIGGPRNAQGALIKKLPGRTVDAFHALTDAKDAGAITPDEYAEQAGYLKAGVPGDVQKVRAFVQEKLDAHKPDVPTAPPVVEPTPAGPGDQPARSGGDVGPVVADPAPGRVGPAASPDAGVSPNAPVVAGSDPNAAGVDGTKIAPVVLGADPNAPGADAAKAASASSALEDPYTQYIGRAVSVEMPHPTDDTKTVRRGIKDAGAALTEADARINRFEALARCLDV